MKSKFIMSEMQKNKISANYYVYHIEGKKVGITNDLDDRVTRQQGYKVGEYEVLATINNIYIASFVEMLEQAQRGYQVETEPYYMMFSSVRDYITHTTASTTGFAAKDKDELYELLELAKNAIGGVTINLPGLGECIIDTEAKVDWIVNNINISHQDNSLPVFIYNKTFFEECKRAEQVGTDVWDFDKIRGWAQEKGLYGCTLSSIDTQTLKLGEECGELFHAVLKDKPLEVKDAIGDIIVVLTSLAELNGNSIEECIQYAWTQIKDRKGDTNSRGDFIKH